MVLFVLWIGNKKMSKKKKVPHRDLIAKDMLLSGKFRMKVIPNKKKKIKKFNWNREKCKENFPDFFYLYFPKLKYFKNNLPFHYIWNT